MPVIPPLCWEEGQSLQCLLPNLVAAVVDVTEFLIVAARQPAIESYG